MNTDKQYYTYIVRCGDGSLYTGYAANVEARLSLHNSGKGAKYTRSRLPVTLCYAKRFSTRAQAQSFEAQIKQLTRTQKLLVIQDWDGNVDT